MKARKKFIHPVLKLVKFEVDDISLSKYGIYHKLTTRIPPMTYTQVNSRGRKTRGGPYYNRNVDDVTITGYTLVFLPDETVVVEFLGDGDEN